MDAEQALRELMELSSQIVSAVVLDADGAVIATSSEEHGAGRLPETALELVAAAGDLGSTAREVSRVEVELADGAVFVVREGGYTVAATTGSSPTSGLVVYDLRTCAQAIEAPAPKKRRPRKTKDGTE